MSTPFYDLASLVLVPSGYKAQKVYAQKPLTTDGQLTFSRASTATRVNSAGLIEAVSSNVPRLDYLGSTCPKLLLEPQRTNLATYSEQANQYSLVRATIGSNVLASPDGTSNADSLIEDADNGAHAFFSFGLTTFTAAAYTASVFAKKGSRDWCALQIYDGTQGFTAYFNLNTGVAGSVGAGATSTITNYGNGWYRCTITATTAAGSTGGIAIYSAIANNSISYAGTNGLTAGYFYGWQLELGAYATSYVKTEAATVTRLADACIKTGVSSLLGATQGTIFMEVDFKYNNGSNNYTRMWNAWDSSNIKVLSLWARDNFLSYQFYDAALSVNVEDSITATQGVHKLAMAYNGTNLKVYMDGALITNTTMSASANWSLTAYGSGTLWTNPTQNHSTQLKQGLLFATALTAAQLAELTTL